jgi:hypothetical protein
MTQRFEYPFQSHYATVDGIRIHHLDEGQGPAILSDGDMAWKPDEGARIAQLVPDGQFYLVHHAGHFLLEDAGTEVAEQMIQFLRSHNIG